MKHEQILNSEKLLLTKLRHTKAVYWQESTHIQTCIHMYKGMSSVSKISLLIKEAVKKENRLNVLEINMHGKDG